MKRRPIAGLAGIAALFFLALPLTQAGDWWNWRGPAEDGYSNEKDLPDTWSPDPEAANNNLVWKAPYGSRSTPIVMNGRVFFINYSSKKVKDANGKISDVPETIQERVMCLDADTGKLIWQYKFNVWHTDIVTVRLGWTNLAGDPETGNVYAHGTQGMLICFDRDGKVLWQHSLTEEYGRISGYGGRLASPLVDGELVIVGMNNSAWGNLAKGGNRFVAFDKRNGHVRWWSEPGGPPKDSYYSTPVGATVGGERVIFSGGADGGLYAMKAHTGEVVWTYYFGTTAVNPSPVVEGNLVYIGQGEENPDNNKQGRVICVDASQVENGQPKLIWQRDGIKARYTSPIIHDGRLYITDDTATLFCLDGAKGKTIWRYGYGRDARGSPVLADGKIYIGEVNSKFHILKPGPKKCTELHEQFFPSPDGFTDVEINGSAAVANGRVYFSTSEETYCIGSKQAVKTVRPPTLPTNMGSAPITHLQVVPADVAVYPGETVSFTVRGYDAHGNLIGEQTVDDWSLPTPPVPPGAKQGPPALKGKIAGGKLTVDAKVPSQAGYAMASSGKLKAMARVRVVPRVPYTQDFEKIPEGAVPGGWVNTQGKFKVTTLNGNKVLAKENTKSSPLLARGNAYFGMPDMHDYTIEADVMATAVKTPDEVILPDLGICVNRYQFYLAGNIQKLRLNSWSVLPRVDKTIDFAWQPNQWYTMKATATVTNGKGTIRGKIWQRGQAEPNEWTIELHDDYPNTEGAPALYGYVLGIEEGNGVGTGVYFDNVRLTPNAK